MPPLQEIYLGKTAQTSHDLAAHSVNEAAPLINVHVTLGDSSVGSGLWSGIFDFFFFLEELWQVQTHFIL